MLVGLGATLLGTGRLLAQPSKPTTQTLLYVAARRENNGQFSAAIVHPTKGILQSLPLPDRGHDIVQHPSSRTCVVFARRPGNFAVAFHLDEKHSPLSFTTPADRHFYGHGGYSVDGRLLFATENNFVDGTGRIGIYDASNGYNRIGEFSSFGIGPHDLAVLPDGKTLIVANGGIQTHPDWNRRPLNLASMKPSLVYMNARNGELLERHEFPEPLHQISIRHLAVGVDGRIGFGCQFKGAKSTGVPVVGIHERGRPLSFLKTQSAVWAEMRNYVGSVEVDRSGEFLCVSCPKAGKAFVFDMKTSTLIETHAMKLVSGIARAEKSGDFTLTSGAGRVRNAGHAKDIVSRNTLAWDNHALAVRSG